jgi:hypothetical protein
MLRTYFGGALAVIALVALVTDSANAVSVTLNAVQDATILGCCDDTTTNGTLLRIHGGGDLAVSLYQFDLSGLGPAGNIMGAHFELYDTGVEGAGTAFTSSTYLVYPDPALLPEELVYFNTAGDIAFDADGMREENMTYSAYAGATPQIFIESPEMPSLQFDLADSSPALQYHASGAADGDTVSLLNTLADSPGYVIFLSWRGTGFRTFGDRESGNPPKLVLELATAPSLEGDYNSDGIVDAADYVAWRKNPADHGGDPDGYNTWVQHFGEPGAGSSGAFGHSAVPEPVTYSFGLLTLLVFAFARRRQSRKNC